MQSRNIPMILPHRCMLRYHLPDGVKDEEAGPILCRSVTASTACSDHWSEQVNGSYSWAQEEASDIMDIQYTKVMGMCIIAVDGSAEKGKAMLVSWGRAMDIHPPRTSLRRSNTSRHAARKVWLSLIYPSRAVRLGRLCCALAGGHSWYSGRLDCDG